MERGQNPRCDQNIWQYYVQPLKIYFERKFNIYFNSYSNGYLKKIYVKKSFYYS